MSISNKKIESYKLDHETIQRINSRRLKKHADDIYSLDRSYYCGCCGEATYDIYDNHEDEREEHQAVKRYLHFIVKTLKSKPDYKDMIKEEAEKRFARKERQKNKGSQKLSKSKRKKNKQEEDKRKKWLEQYESKKKALKSSKNKNW